MLVMLVVLVVLLLPLLLLALNVLLFLVSCAAHSFFEGKSMVTKYKSGTEEKGYYTFKIQNTTHTSSQTNGLRLVPPLGNLLLLRHVYSACVVTIMLRSITCMVYGGGYEACHQDLYDPTGEQDLDGFDGFDC